MITPELRRKVALAGEWIRLKDGSIVFRWQGMFYGRIVDKRRAYGAKGGARYEVEDSDDDFDDLRVAKAWILDHVTIPRLIADGFIEVVSGDE